MAITKLNSLAIPDDTIVEADLSYPLTGFSSTGIDDNATSTAITIDASEKVGIGTAIPAVQLDVATTSGSAYVNINRNSQSAGEVGLSLYGGTSGINWSLYQPTSSNDIRFYGNGADRLTINSSGNCGIGNSSLSDWSSSFTALQIGQAASFWAVDTLPYAYMSANQFYDGASKYIVNGPSSWYVQELGTHKWFIAPSGTAGNTISFTQAMTLDSSGHLLIGKDSTALNTSGAYIAPSGVIVATRDSAEVLALNLTNSDGNIASFYKDGTTVGSIGAASNGLYIGSDDAGIFFNDHGGGDLDAIFPYDVGTNTFYNGHVDIGGSSNKFRNIHISGSLSTGDGVTFGSTGGSVTSKTLYDYEEGIWTPVIGGSTGTSGQSYTTQVGHYTKIGRQVIVTFLVDLSNKGTITGDCVLSGLPFACLNNNGSGAGVISYFDNLTANVSSMSLNGNQNNASAYINHVVGSGATATVNTTAIIGTSTRLDGVFSYFTA